MHRTSGDRDDAGEDVATVQQLSLRDKVAVTARALRAEPDRKPTGQVARELVAIGLQERVPPIHYATNLLYRRSAGDPRDTVGRVGLREIRDALFLPLDPDVDDKLLFQARALEAGLPVPALLDLVRPMGTPVEERVRQLEQAREQTPRRAVFVKPHRGNSGQGCHRLGPEATRAEVLEVARSLRSGIFLVVEALAQHPVVSRVSPGAVGCLRVHTRRAGDAITVLSVLMRFGTGSMVVDTPSRGALFAPVDTATGTVRGPALGHFQLGARQHATHPLTGAEFDGTVLPDWPAVLALVERAALAFHKPMVGWDVAVTEDGPVVVEGNSVPHLMLAQMAVGGFRRHPGWWPLVEPVLSRAGRGAG